MPHDPVYYPSLPSMDDAARPALKAGAAGNRGGAIREDGFWREYMYPQFFGFDKLPFRLRRDPDFLLSGPDCLRARSKVLDDLRGKSRVVFLTGPAGVGKTLLLEEVLREIGGQFGLCRINQPHISATELLQALLLQLGTPPAGGGPGRVPPVPGLAAAPGATAAREAAPPPLLHGAPRGARPPLA